LLRRGLNLLLRFGWGRLAEVNRGQRKKIGGFEQGDLFLGISRVRGHGFQGGDGVGAAELLGGLNGCVPDFFFPDWSGGQDI